MAQIFGRAFITVAGKRYNTKEGASLKFGGVSREAVVGDAGVAGFQEKLEAPQVECTIICTPDISLKDIQGIKNATISFDTDNGKSFVMTEAFSGPAPELSRDGIKATFFGLDCKEA